jgi:hypothetical protein
MPADIAYTVTIVVFFIIFGSVAIDCSGKILGSTNRVWHNNRLAKVEFWITLHVAGCRVYMYGTKVPDKRISDRNHEDIE